MWSAWFANHATQEAMKKLSKSIRNKKKEDKDPDEIQQGWSALKGIIGGMQ